MEQRIGNSPCEEVAVRVYLREEIIRTAMDLTIILDYLVVEVMGTEIS